MLRIDAHQHFWQFDPVRDSWLREEDMYILRRDFGPVNFAPMLNANHFDGCVLVQVSQSPEENTFQLAHAGSNPFVKGVVGWVDLQAADIADQLAMYSEYPLLKGFRHILQGETQRDFMLRPDFLRGIGTLKKFGFTYDVLIFPDQLAFTREFVANFPDQPFVLDHIAKPDIKGNSAFGESGSPKGGASGKADPASLVAWQKEIRALARFENVSCKVSGMVTEAAWLTWKGVDFRPYLDTVVEAFGMKRLMFGSDWPMCLLSATYADTVALVADYFAAFSIAEKDAFFGGNAVQFYNI